MVFLNASQEIALKKEQDNLFFQVMSAAALAAFWSTSTQFNAQFNIDNQNLSDVTDAIGGENNTDELLEGLDVLTSIGGDAISSIFASLVGTGLFAGYTYSRSKTYDKTKMVLFSQVAFGVMLGKSVAYIGAKEITAQIAMHTITAANPLLHIPMSITFAFFYGLFSTLFAEYAKYKAIKPMKELACSTPTPYTFRQHMNTRKDLLKEFYINCMTGLALYGSTLIPGLNTVESVATTVAITLATAGGARVAWTIVNAPQLQNSGQEEDKNNSAVFHYPQFY